MNKAILTAALVLALVSPARAGGLVASWYSIRDLKRDGQWRISGGRTASGEMFQDSALTCAARLWPLGTRLKITNKLNGRSVVVRVNDRIGRRFAKSRIDLSRAAFERLDALSRGIIPIESEVIKR